MSKPLEEQLKDKDAEIVKLKKDANFYKHMCIDLMAGLRTCKSTSQGVMDDCQRRMKMMEEKNEQ